LAPAFSASPISSANRAKFADSIEGANSNLGSKVKVQDKTKILPDYGADVNKRIAK
jgi:hypothetical protein